MAQSVKRHQKKKKNSTYVEKSDKFSHLFIIPPHFPSFLYPIIDCCYFAVYLTLSISRAIFDYISLSPELYLITSHELYLIISQCLTINPCQLSLSHYQFSMSPNIMYFQFFHCVYRKVTLINSVYQFYYPTTNFSSSNSQNLTAYLLKPFSMSKSISVYPFF